MSRLLPPAANLAFVRLGGEMPEPDVVFQLVFALELGVAVNAFERSLVAVTRRQVASQVLALVEQLPTDVTFVTSTAVVDETVAAEHALVHERCSALDSTMTVHVLSI